jgi:hypothetical protein
MLLVFALKYHYIVFFKKNANFGRKLAENWPKIAEIRDQNIDPGFSVPCGA